MKTKLILIAIFLAAFSINSFSQVKIVPNKVEFKRVGENVPDFKKTFTITYPVVVGLDDYQVEENLVKTLNYWNNFEGSVEENLGNYHWLEELSYLVNYNKNSVLDITLIMEGSGAYPSTYSKNLVIDLKTGQRVYIKDVFTNVDRLLLKIDKAKQLEEQKEIAERREYSADDAETLKEMLDENKHSINKLEEFSVNDEGVTFHFDYGFPHVIKALAPAGRYFFKWSELKPFIKLEGLLGQFVR